jgi:hypothetical protein
MTLPPPLSYTISCTTISPPPPPLTKLCLRLFEHARPEPLAPEAEGDWDALADGVAGGVPTMVDRKALIPNVVYELSLSLSSHAKKKKDSETKVFVSCSTERLFCFLFPLLKITSKHA